MLGRIHMGAEKRLRPEPDQRRPLPRGLHRGRKESLQSGFLHLHHRFRGDNPKTVPLQLSLSSSDIVKIMDVNPLPFFNIPQSIPDDFSVFDEIALSWNICKRNLVAKLDIIKTDYPHSIADGVSPLWASSSKTPTLSCGAKISIRLLAIDRKTPLLILIHIRPTAVLR